MTPPFEVRKLLRQSGQQELCRTGRVRELWFAGTVTQLSNMSRKGNFVLIALQGEPFDLKKHYLRGSSIRSGADGRAKILRSKDGSSMHLIGNTLSIGEKRVEVAEYEDRDVHDVTFLVTAHPKDIQ